jgi:hypothetical protein
MKVLIATSEIQGHAGVRPLLDHRRARSSASPTVLKTTAVVPASPASSPGSRRVQRSSSSGPTAPQPRP